MKDNIKNNSATLDMLKALNPNIKKDFNGDNTKSYFCNVVKEETNKDGELEIILRLGSMPKRLDTKSKAAEEMIAYIKNTAALNDIFNKSQEDIEREREHRIHFSISSIAKRSARRHGLNLFKSKTIELAVTGGNSSGAVITSNHVITVEFNNLNSWLDFNKMLRKTKFLKEVKTIENKKLLYKFNIKVYNKHELNMDQTLSNYSDMFVKWYLSLCSKENSKVLNIDAISDLATRLFDDDWCQLDSIMYQK